MHRVYRYGNPVFMVELYQYHSVDERGNIEFDTNYL